MLLQNYSNRKAADFQRNPLLLELLGRFELPDACRFATASAQIKRALRAQVGSSNHVPIRNKLPRRKARELVWSCWADSNCRPHPYQGCALPTELQQQMATKKGLEPSTSGVTGRRSNQLSYLAVTWWEQLDSNQ